MISSKELRYVDLWANRIPMPGYDYSMEVLNNIENCYKLYNEKYKDKEYSIIFSNSEEIDFQILPKKLCHMMGIDYSNIKSDFFNEYREKVFGTAYFDMSTYDLLEEILKNKEKVAELDNDPNNSAKAINYYKSAIKCAIFNKFSNFDEFNFGAINYVGDNEKKNYNEMKMLFLPSNEALTPYFMMGIIKSKDVDSFGKYLVYTLMAPIDNTKYFDNQEVIIPTQILVSNNDNLSKLVATPDEKIQLLTMYENIINKYSLPNKLNIFGDYGAILSSMANNEKQKVMIKK